MPKPDIILEILGVQLLMGNTKQIKITNRAAMKIDNTKWIMQICCCTFVKKRQNIRELCHFK